MKKVFILFFAFSSILTLGQNYKPFNANSKKLFAKKNIEIDSTFSFAFDSVAKQGSDSVYFNYTGVGKEIESDSCYFWGGPWCYQQNKALWNGTHIVTDNIGFYRFFNAIGDTLSFNFNIQQGDSSLFYQDSIQKFYLVFEGIETENILGFTDSVKVFRIAHTDNFGNTIYSELNNETVVIGKETGLVDFFRIDVFPNILEPFTIIGNTSPDLGLNKITYEMLVDFQVGDEIQYYKSSYVQDGPPWENYQRYIKYIYLNRTDTQDSIIYKMAKITFEKNENEAIYDTVFAKYKRDEVLASIPFEAIKPDWNLIMKSLTQVDYCGLRLWTYTIVPEYLTYCAKENCWGSYDIPGPPPDQITVYVCGLGKYSEKDVLNYSGGYSNWYGINYFKKGEIICGGEVYVGINEAEVIESNFSVYPNPAVDYLIIQSENKKEGIVSIYNLNGQEIISEKVTGFSTKINLSNLSPGIFLVRIISVNYVEVKKIIKE